jgi:hypothetical protein
MLYRIYIILFLIGVLDHGTALAQSSRYRVELLVLSHLDNQALPIEEPALTDYTTALDLLVPPDDEEDAAEASPQEPEPPAADVVAAADGGGVDELAADPVSLVVHLPEMGPEMQDAWRRLRLSGPFRPLQHLAWEQSGDEPFPTLRLHDEEVVMTDDPWADLRLLQAEDVSTAVFGDAAGLAQQTGDSEAELPDPRVYYRLDGTAKLRRSRFLHLHLDFEWREPVYAAPAPAAADPIGNTDPSAAAPAPAKLRSVSPPGAAIDTNAGPRPSAFLVHSLRQNRQIKTGRMTYFDSPMLGVLALVTDVSDLYEDENATSETLQ